MVKQLAKCQHGKKEVSTGEVTETLYKEDRALSTKPGMLIRAPLIPATRWSYTQQSLPSAVSRLQLHLAAEYKGCSDKHHIGKV